MWNFSSRAQLEEKIHIYVRPCIILYLSLSPTPHPILEKVRLQYNHNSSLELPHYVYIFSYV